MQKPLQILAQVGKLLLRAAGRITAEFAITSDKKQADAE